MTKKSHLAYFLSLMMLVPLSTSIQAQERVGLDASNSTTKSELAMMQVFYDLCPKLIKKSQKKRFYKQFNVLIKTMLPSISAPDKVLETLKDDKDFQKLVRVNKKATNSFSKAENKMVCQDILNVKP